MNKVKQQQCPHGKSYTGKQCTCKACEKQRDDDFFNTDTATGDGNSQNTEAFSEFDDNDSNKTEFTRDERKSSKTTNRKANPTPDNGTHYGGDFDSDSESENSNNEEKEELRVKRKLVGWLITYSIDPLGIDYKLYEGRNVIGRSNDCNITVGDKTMSGKHATILFRAGKYKIKDELSAHGTFVCGEDIEEQTFELHDGDLIRMGKTVVFEFKAPASL